MSEEIQQLVAFNLHFEIRFKERHYFYPQSSFLPCTASDVHDQIPWAWTVPTNSSPPDELVFSLLSVVYFRVDGGIFCASRWGGDTADAKSSSRTWGHGSVPSTQDGWVSSLGPHEGEREGRHWPLKLQVIVLFKKKAIDGSIAASTGKAANHEERKNSVLEIWPLTGTRDLDPSICVWLDFTLCSNYVKRG